jgi:hypothetical protein
MFDPQELSTKLQRVHDSSTFSLMGMTIKLRRRRRLTSLTAVESAPPVLRGAIAFVATFKNLELAPLSMRLRKSLSFVHISLSSASSAATRGPCW